MHEQKPCPISDTARDSWVSLYAGPSSLFPLSLHPFIWCICLFVIGHSRWIKPLYRHLHWSLCASNQNTLHCHQSGTERERDLTLRLIPSISSHVRNTPSNTWGLDNVQVNGQWLSISVWMCLSGKYAVDRLSLRVGKIFARMFGLFARGLPQWH